MNRGVLVYFITYWTSKSQKRSKAAYVLTGLFAIVLLNVLFPHLLASIFFVTYAPGVVTGLVFNLPVTLYLISRAIREQFVEPKMLPKATAYVAMPAVSFIALLFYVGSAIK